MTIFSISRRALLTTTVASPAFSNVDRFADEPMNFATEWFRLRGRISEATKLCDRAEITGNPNRVLEMELSTLYHVQDRLIARIGGTPAMSLGGVHSKVQVLAHLIEPIDAPEAHQIIVGLETDLQRLCRP